MRRYASLLRIVPAALLLIAFLTAIAGMRMANLRLPCSVEPVEITGSFPEEAVLPHGKSALNGQRYWGSWAGNDNNTGSIKLGPFKALHRLGIQVSGYPRIGKNSITARNTATGETIRQEIPNIGEMWEPIMLQIPEAWHGQPIEINAVDDAQEWGGWLALSEPFTIPRWTAWMHGFVYRLCSFVFVGLAAWVMVVAAASVLVRCGAVRAGSSFLPPLAFAIVATLGYLAFWIGFFSRTAMHLTLGATFGIALLQAMCAVTPGAATKAETSGREGGKSLRPGAELFESLAITAVSAIFIFSLLHLFGQGGPLSELAQLRFSQVQLPSDNTIPQFLAERILKGEPAKTMFGDWHSSDRPPLQAGWILLFSGVSRAVDIDYDTAAQCAGIVLQCLALPVVWALLRQLGAGRSAAAALVFIVTASCFFFMSLGFVWPKMAGGGLAVLAFLLWFAPRAEQEWPGRSGRFAWAGLAAGLAWLAHGGVAFAFIASAPFALHSFLSPRWRGWFVSAGLFLAIALPWSAYQKYYDPPGNRLLKWHLGGVVPPDERGTVETLLSSYRALSWNEWLASRGQNLNSIVRGHWSDLVTFSTRHAVDRRSDEFFHTLYALGWWNLGLVAALVLVFTRQEPAAPTRHFIVRVLLWSAATLAVWALLMFVGGTTLIHQGSYTTLLVMYALGPWALLRLHRVLFAAVALAHLVTFVSLWFTPPNEALDRSRSPAAFAATLLCAAAAVLVVVLLARREQRDASAAPICGPSSA